MKRRRQNLFIKKLAASTLLETITASVIFMIIFGMSMDILTRFIVFNNRDIDYLIVENDLRRCQKQIMQTECTPKCQKYAYEWGNIEVNISKYREAVYEVEMFACTTNNRHQIHFRFLKVNE